MYLFLKFFIYFYYTCVLIDWPNAGLKFSQIKFSVYSSVAYASIFVAKLELILIESNQECCLLFVHIILNQDSRERYSIVDAQLKISMPQLKIWNHVDIFFFLFTFSKTVTSSYR